MTLYSENLAHMAPVWTRIFPIEAERAEGCYIYANDGRKYLDFTCGIGVTNTGHCHPKVVEAIREQAGLFLHAQANLVIHKPMMELIAELRTIVPPAIDGFFFSNSGAEALEGAVKLARAVTGKPNFIVFQFPMHAEHHLACHAHFYVHVRELGPEDFYSPEGSVHISISGCSGRIKVNPVCP